MKGSERTARILVNDSRIYLDTDALARGAVDFLLPGAIKCEECGYAIALHEGHNRRHRIR